MSLDFGDLETFILEKMRESKTPGLSIAMVEDDEIKYAKGFGFRNISDGLQATPRTLYGIASATKSFTALAVMQLVEQGKLSLDDPVERYVPAFPRIFGESPTIHHFLSHSSGLPNLGSVDAFIFGSLGFDDNWLPITTPEEVANFVKDAGEWAVAKPGKQFLYSNECYILLGHIVSKLSGIPYEEYVRKNILDPLKMTRSFYSKADVDKEADVATPYIIDKDRKYIPSSYPYRGATTASGGLISNVLDLSKYLLMCIEAGRYDGKELVSRRMFEAMEEPHIPLSWRVYGNESYGYGWWTIPDFFGCKLVEHTGWLTVSSAFVGYVREKRIGVAILGNPAGRLEQIGQFAIAQLIGEDAQKLPSVRQDRILRKLEGDYETYKSTVRFTVKRQGDLLIAQFKNKYIESSTPLIPETLEENRAVFTYFSDGAKLTSEFNMSGGKIEWIFDPYKAIKIG